MKTPKQNNNANTENGQLQTKGEGRSKSPSKFFLTTQKKIENSTSTVEELRVPIYAPIKKLSKRSVTYQAFKKNKNVRVVTTKWGEVEIRNRILTQTHKDIIDLIFTYRKKVKELDDGSIALYFSQTEIAQMYGDKGNNLKWFREKLQEIRDCVILYRNNQGDEYDFNIIRNKAFSYNEDHYGIVLDARYIQFYEQGLSVNYAKEVNQLVDMDSPLIKSIIRFFFTHNAINMTLDDVFDTVGYPKPASDRTLQRARREIKDHSELLLEYGIDYNEKKRMFYYKGHDSVKMIPKVHKKQGSLIDDKTESINVNLNDFSKKKATKKIEDEEN